jgi:hypothetical protein
VHILQKPKHRLVGGAGAGVARYPLDAALDALEAALEALEAAPRCRGEVQAAPEVAPPPVDLEHPAALALPVVSLEKVVLVARKA